MVMQVLIALDQLANALLARGMADETLSARLYRLRETGKPARLAYKAVNMLFFWQDDHCKDAYWSEMQRKQLPKEYQRA